MSVASAAKNVAALPSGPFEFSLLDCHKLADPALIDELKTLFEDHKGETDVHLVVHTSAGPKTLRFGSQYRVQPSASLRQEIDQLLGSGAIAA